MSKREKKTGGLSRKLEAKIDDVAQIAGVSKATVSRVMNRPHLVNEETLKKVQKVMSQLNYTPNVVAQSMRSQKTRTVGVVIPELKNPFYSGMLFELENELCKADYMMIICPTSGDFEQEKDYIARMMQRRIDGVFFFTYNNGKEHIKEILEITKKTPFILMDEPTDDLPVNQVVTNGYAGVRDAVEYLIGKGHTKIACICSKMESASKRFEGYRDAMQQNGLPIRKEFVLSAGFTLDDGKQAAEQLLQLEEKPSVVVCSADAVAVGMMSKLIKNGVRVPEDIEILGFNNGDLADVVSPPLSTIGQNMPELSRQAVKMMMELINEPDMNYTNIVKIPAELVLRDSTK